jgi:methylase of polypeptide subunit release factors
VDPGVFDPQRHLSGVAFAPHLCELVAPGSRVLDLGTGCGILAAAAAAAGAAEVVATDIDERAVACARRNLADLEVVEVRHGDLFAPVAGRRFDLVVVNPPYVIGPSDDLTRASPDLLARLGGEVAQHTDRLVLGYPADEVEALSVTGLPLEVWRTVPTRGRALAILVADLG